MSLVLVWDWALDPDSLWSRVQHTSHHGRACTTIPWHPAHTFLHAACTTSSAHSFQRGANQSPAQSTPVRLQRLGSEFLLNSSNQATEHLELLAGAQRLWISAKHHLQQRWHIWKSWKHNSFTNPQPAHPVRTEVFYSLIRKSVSLTTENKSFLAFIKQFHTEGKSDPVILSSPLSCLGTSSLLLLVFPTDPTKAFSAHSSPEHTCSLCRVCQGRICLYLVQSH